MKTLANEVQSALEWLKEHATKATLDGMARYAIPSDHALGVAMKDIKALGKQLGVPTPVLSVIYAALKLYADWLQITEAKAKRTRDEFFPPPAIEPDTITGLDMIVKDAVELKFTATEMTKEQLGELIQIPPR